MDDAILERKYVCTVQYVTFFTYDTYDWPAPCDSSQLLMSQHPHRIKQATRNIIVIIIIMGGDGGTKAIQRAYLRNAGSATTTGDGARPPSKAVDPTVAAQEWVHRWTHCALTDQPLFGKSETSGTNTTDTTANTTTTTTTDKNSIVACPFGRLYFREAVVEALIRRKQHEKEASSSATGQQQQPGSDSEIRHIRGLKDLYAVQFHVQNHHPVCPVTSRELTSKGCVAYALLLLKNDDDNDNRAAPVVSQYALQQIGEAELLQEYGAQRKLRLAPPADVLVEIQRQWQEQCAAEKKVKKKKKRTHQRKDDNGGDEPRDDGAQCKKTKTA